MKLSILICSVNNRVDNFLQNIYKQVNEQLVDEVEVLTIIDNRTMSIWEKRNRLIGMAKWDYIAFVDDDDKIEWNYVRSLLEWIKSWADVICFNAKISINGWQYKLVRYWKDLEHWVNMDCYTRKPNHLMCWKRSIAKTVKYKNISFLEDTIRAKRMYKKISSERYLDRTLYYYDYNEDTSESVKRRDQHNNTNA